mmetsp:Transcript_5162/g.18473  ORF Transcript_5162/g.18473 Transcript_5162/m.18473 type:complete len:215 (-) Transcript_5162:37-681(-)
MYREDRKEHFVRVLHLPQHQSDVATSFLALSAVNINEEVLGAESNWSFLSRERRSFHAHLVIFQQPHRPVFFMLVHEVSDGASPPDFIADTLLIVVDLPADLKPSLVHSNLQSTLGLNLPCCRFHIQIFQCVCCALLYILRLFIVLALQGLVILVVDPIGSVLARVSIMRVTRFFLPSSRGLLDIETARLASSPFLLLLFIAASLLEVSFHAYT